MKEKMKILKAIEESQKKDDQSYQKFLQKAKELVEAGRSADLALAYQAGRTSARMEIMDGLDY